MQWKPVTVVLAAHVLLSLGVAQSGVMAEAYTVVRPTICALMKKTTNCPLPSDIILPTSWNEVKGALDTSQQIYLVGSLEQLRKEVFPDLFERGLKSDKNFNVNYASLKKDVDAVLNVYRTAKLDKAFTLSTITIANSDINNLITRIPFVFTDNRFFGMLEDRAGNTGWFVFSGNIANTVQAVIISALPLLAEAAKRDAQVRADQPVNKPPVVPTGSASSDATPASIPTPETKYLPLEGSILISEPTPGFNPAWIKPGSNVMVLLVDQAPIPSWVRTVAQHSRVQIRQTALISPMVVISNKSAYSPIVGWTDNVNTVGMLWRVFSGAWEQGVPVIAR